MYEELNPSKLFLIEKGSSLDLEHAKKILEMSGFTVKEFPSGFNSPKITETRQIKTNVTWQDIYDKNV